MSLLLALALQVGPHVGGAPRPASPLPPELQNRRPPRAAVVAPPSPPPPPDRMRLCLAKVDSAPSEAAAMASSWLAEVRDAARTQPGHCLGAAQVRLGKWPEAERAFLAARDAAEQSDTPLRARLGAMAGNAAMAAGAATRALAAFDQADADALAASEPMLAGDIAIDRAQALVALKREAEAEKALTEARAASPTNPLGWLFSATLSRRMGKLAQAQVQIERAAELQPEDPEVALEAGLIAAIMGRYEAARRSWQSVVALAPQSEAATAARGYLEQLGK